MDGSRFDHLTRGLAAPVRSRRAALGALVGGLAGFAGASAIRTEAAPLEAAACTPNGQRCGRGKRAGKIARRKCRRCCSRCTAGKKIGKLRCACCPTGARCKGGYQCCSGLCQGGLCVGFETPGAETCESPLSVCDSNSSTCGGADGNCACITTLSGSGCYHHSYVCYEGKTTCNDDADCIGEFGPGFACIAANNGPACEAPCGGNGNACVPPCNASGR